MSSLTRTPCEQPYAIWISHRNHVDITQSPIPSFRPPVRLVDHPHHSPSQCLREAHWSGVQFHTYRKPINNLAPYALNRSSAMHEIFQSWNSIRFCVSKNYTKRCTKIDGCIHKRDSQKLSWAQGLSVQSRFVYCGLGIKILEDSYSFYHFFVSSELAAVQFHLCADAQWFTHRKLIITITSRISCFLFVIL